MTGQGWVLPAAILGGVLVFAFSGWARSNGNATISRARRRTMAIVVFTCVTAVLLAGNGLFLIRWTLHGGRFPFWPMFTLVGWLFAFAGFLHETRPPG